MKLHPVPLDGLAPGADQLQVYGAVPPLAVAVKVTGVPVWKVVGPLMATVRGSGLIVIVVDPDATLPLVSVAFTLTV